MDTNNELYKAGLLLHGHKCPAMPMGLRAGQAALEALGVERAKDDQFTENTPSFIAFKVTSTKQADIQEFLPEVRDLVRSNRLILSRENKS